MASRTSSTRSRTAGRSTCPPRRRGTAALPRRRAGAGGRRRGDRRLARSPAPTQRCTSSAAAAATLFRQRLLRRPAPQFVFSASNDLDFDFDRTDRSSGVVRSYRRAAASCDRLVAQTSQQLALAERPSRSSTPADPELCQPAEPSTADGRYLLWADRLVDYKRPASISTSPSACRRSASGWSPRPPTATTRARGRHPPPRRGPAEPRAAARDAARAAARGDRRGHGRGQDLAGRGDAEHVPRGLGARRPGAVVRGRPRRADRPERRRRRRRRVARRLRGREPGGGDPDLRRDIGASGRERSSKTTTRPTPWPTAGAAPRAARR